MPASTYSSTSSPLPEPHLVKTRASKGKSRSGCVTCKKRKVKCDERRPGCLNCSRRSQGCVYSIKTLPKWRERTGTFVVKDLRVKESPPARKDDEDVVDEVEVRSDESLDVVDMDGERAYGNGVVLPTTLSCVSSDFGQTFGIEDFYLLTQFESLTDLDMLNYYELEVNDVIQLGFNVSISPSYILTKLTLLAERVPPPQHARPRSAPSRPLPSIIITHNQLTLQPQNPRAPPPTTHTLQISPGPHTFETYKPPRPPRNILPPLHLQLFQRRTNTVRSRLLRRRLIHSPSRRTCYYRPSSKSTARRPV